MTPIRAVRFNAIAGYARLPQASLFGEEIGYFETAGGRVVGMLMRDRTDGDYVGMAFAPDRRLRLRSVRLTEFVRSAAEARADLAAVLDEVAAAPPETHHQDGDAGAPVDFFTPVRPRERLHPHFVALIEEEANSPARGVIGSMMRWYDDVDGNFVEQFQTMGFDQRIWELYMFATLVEAGFTFDRASPMPDFTCNGLAGSFSVEAATVGPTRLNGVVVPPPPTDTHARRAAYLGEYMPIKFGSALRSKLLKRYWEREHVAGMPFAIAVADFSSTGSMSNTGSALETYLYGFRYEGARDADGGLTIVPHRIEEHRFGEKVVPSGFFRLPEAVDVAAVLTSAVGTLSKFNRMGVQAGFGSGRLILIHEGSAMDESPGAERPRPFRALVNAPDYRESWIEGLNVFHNPDAKRPLHPALLPGAAHHFCTAEGLRTSAVPAFHPFGSRTWHLTPDDQS